MKRISIIIASAFAAMLSASCSKSIETPAAPSPGEGLILDLSIAGFDGAGDTKAVKKGWVAGDKINLWFDDWNYTEQANNPIPDLVITYDGSKWTADALAAGRSLKPNGKFSVLYEGGNDLSKCISYRHADQQFFEFPNLWVAEIGERSYYYHMIYRKEDVSYTYSGNKLTAAIADWYTPSAFKVLVKGLDPAAAGDYALQTVDVTTPGTEKYPATRGGFCVKPRSTSPEFLSPGGNYKGGVGGVPDADGVAFYYLSCNFSTATVEFRLFKKDAGGNFVRTASAPQFTGKTLVTDGKSIKGIVIDKSKFE